MPSSSTRRAIWQAAILSVAVLAAALTILVEMTPPSPPAAPIAAQATATLLPPGIKTLSPLSIQGTTIVDATGKHVTLLGVTRSSLEYLCGGDGHYQLADFKAIRAWGANVVRLTLSSEFWANPHQSCPPYHATVEAAVSNARAAGLYVILAMQQNAPADLPNDEITGGAQCPLPDASKDLAFWHDLSALYRDNGDILFEILSEPHAPSQDIWFAGGTVTSDCNNTYPQPITYTGLGMDAFASKIRGYAPHTILIISGNGYGYDVSGVGQTYHFHAKNLLFATHAFDHPTVQRPDDWARAFGEAAATEPVIATEFGGYNCQIGYISQEIAYFQSLHMSWLAWGWGARACDEPSLIRDWKGTPIAPYGTYIRAQMLAQATKDG
ncbi:MAG: cellulase family glycosylhydrolase [Ktedonobacterales bacterium]|nr:cellulase family glycosylhydrolase [Ktedonobacterales bacterium]